MDITKTQHICIKSFHEHTEGNYYFIYPTDVVTNYRGKVIEHKHITCEGHLLTEDFYREHFEHVPYPQRTT